MYPIHLSKANIVILTKVVIKVYKTLPMFFLIIDFKDLNAETLQIVKSKKLFIPFISLLSFTHPF